MSSLPQRKKSAEEIAKLRDTLGVPNRPADEAAAPPAEPAPDAAGNRSESAPPFRKADALPSAVEATAPPVDHSGLPSRRRSNEEIEALRKREVFEMLNAPPPNPKLVPAHPAAIALGYLLALGGGACFVFDDVHWLATAGCALGSLGVALALFLRRPISKHHAGFMAVISLFVVVFGTLHHFPQLQYAT